MIDPTEWERVPLDNLSAEVQRKVRVEKGLVQYPDLKDPILMYRFSWFDHVTQAYVSLGKHTPPNLFRQRIATCVCNSDESRQKVQS